MSRSPRRSDALLRGASALGALLSAAIALLIAAWLVRESAPALAEVGIGRFLGDARWNPTRGAFGLLPMAAASVAAAVGALLLALPLALATAMFLIGYAPVPIEHAMRLLLELLAAVPSVVVGFFGLIVLVPWLARIEPPGASLLAAILVLALMVLPTLAVMVEAALAGMPEAERSAAAALGLSRATILLRIALPRARRGVVAAALVALGRALGETMAVVMVCGNVVQWPSHLLKPARTLTANVALEMAYASGTHRGALFVSGLLLLATTAVLVLAASWRSGGGATRA